MKRPIASPRNLSLLVVALIAALVVVAAPAAIESAPPAARPTPTVMPAPGNRPQAGPQALCPTCADLVVQSISTFPPVPTVDVTATLRVVIANIGTGSVPDGRNYWVDLYVRPATPPVPFLPGDFQWGAQSWYVPPGGTYVLETPYRFRDTNTYALYAQIDTDNSVTETNELNNVLGPVAINVQSSGVFQQSTHQDFQFGVASGLDLSHPDGVITLGSFEEPWQDAGLGPTSVYSPDVMINDVTASYSGGQMLATTVEQVKPSIVADSGNGIYAVWQDARHGGTYNNRIYFAASADRGATWSPNISITANIPVTTIVNQMAPRIAYDSVLDRLSVVWQDNRRGHYDIWYSSSDDGGATWAPSTRVNDDTVNPSAHKLQPSLVISGGGWVYVAWQDQRNGNDDVYMTVSQDSGATWPSQNTFVTDDPATTVQAQRSPSIGLGHLAGRDLMAGTLLDSHWVYVAWEDWRDAAHPEVYTALSVDNGWTFGVDVPVEYPGGGSYRVAPTMVVISATTTFTTEEEIPGTSQTRVVTKTARVDEIHTAWQEGQDQSADVYYAYAWWSHDPDQLKNDLVPNWAINYFFRPKVKINGDYVDYSWAQPPEPKPRWPLEPSWQGEVSMVAASLPSDICDGEDVGYDGGVLISWSDGRAFDRDRRDIYIARIGHVSDPNPDIKTYRKVNPDPYVCGLNRVVNDNAKLYRYRDDSAMWALTKPANVRQSNPSIALSGGQIYVAWDDDRWDTPLAAGTRRNRDVFFARTAYDQYGVYLSPVFDTNSPLTTWYGLDWFGTTDHQTPTYFQTRTGNTPVPPKQNAAIDTWTVFTGTQPIQMQNGPASPIYVNDAPGQPIVSPPGRYIQYKLIIDGHSRATAVTRVTLHFERWLVPAIYFPSIMKNMADNPTGR